MSKEKNENRVIRVKRGNGKAAPSTVMGLRLDDSLWEQIAEIAEKQRKTRNALIAEVLQKYLESVNGRK